MSIPLTVNGAVFEYPVNFDESWGVDATGWAQAVTNGMLQMQGGSFPLTADVNFGPNFGLLSKYFETRSSNPATTGTVRLSSADAGVAWRNNANSGNLVLTTNASDQLLYNGNPIATGSGGAVTSITGTTNQIIASSPTGAVTLSAPQDIASSSSPTFNRVTHTTDLVLKDSVLANLTIKAPTTLSAPWTLSLPVDDGASGQVLSTDGSGNTSWINAAGGGTVNSGTQFQLAYYPNTAAVVGGSTGLVTNTAGDLFVTHSQFAGAVNIICQNTSVSTSAGAVIAAETAGTGDSWFGTSLTAGESWTFGLDNSAADAFVISNSSALGTNNALSISTSEIVTFPNSPIAPDPSAPQDVATKNYVDSRFSGTTNTIPKFTASNTVGNSAVTDNGTNITTTSRLVDISYPGNTLNPTTQYQLHLQNSTTGTYFYMDSRAAATYASATQIASMGAGTNSGSEFMVTGVGFSNPAIGFTDKILVNVQGNAATVAVLGSATTGASARTYTATGVSGSGTFSLQMVGNAATYQVHILQTTLGVF